MNFLRHLFVSILIIISGICVAQIIKPYTHFREQKAAAPDLINGIVTDTFPANAYYPAKNLSVREGLAQSLINTLFMDSQNRLWIGTYGGGVSVYDGVSFKTINKIHGLSNDVVWKFVEDDSGKIWIATDRGVSIYDGNKFTYLNDESGLENQYVWSLFKDSKGRIWIGTAGGGAFIYENEKLKSFNKSGQLEKLQIYDIVEKKNGDMVFATHSKGIWIMHDSAFSNRLFANETQNIVRTLLVDSLDQIWCGTDDGLIFLGDKGSLTITTANGLPSNRISNLYRDKKNNIWISTRGGVVKSENGNFTIFNSRNGLVDDKVKCVLHDAWGTLWIAFLNDGIEQLIENNGFVHYTKQSGFPTANPSALLRDSKNNIWIGTTEGGPVLYNGKQFTQFKSSTQFDWSSIKVIYEDTTGNIWFGTSSSGVVKYDGKNFYSFRLAQGINSENIWTIQQDKNGDMWFGTQWNAYRYDGNNFYYYNENCGFAYYQVLSSHKDKNDNLWFGTFGGGATYWDGELFYTIRDSHGLANNSILTISTDDDENIWLSTYGEGISILKSDWKNNTGNLTWKKINLLNGLNDDNVKFIHHDQNKDVWIGTNKGLNKICLNGKNIFDVRIPEIISYGYNEGFLGIECFLNGFIQDQSSAFWISSDKMLTKFDLQQRKIQNVAPTIHLTDLKLELRQVRWDSLTDISYSKIDKWNNIPENLSLPYHKNHLQFEFIGICFDRPEGVEYQWKMEGFDPDWSPWSKTRQATYSNLPPGEFSFQIKTRNADKIESEIFSYSFIIHKPFWQKIWFRISAIIFILLIIWGIFRLRTRALRKRQEFLEQTVTERTEELVIQKHIVDEKQKEIIDSINYAKRIQNAILVKEADIQQHLKESFLLYLPKDIVAGDFYFFEVHNNRIFMAVADCTGHGVPGALVSVVCSNALTRSVKEFDLTDPGKILDKTRELIVETMRKSGTTIRDGMDISLISLSVSESNHQTVQWAGANNPLWIIRKAITPIHEISEKQPYQESKPYLMEFTADKQPVGFSEQTAPFKTHEINLEPGDRIYLFTDGFADQFGGPKGKKFKYKNLEVLLCDLHDVSFTAQKENLLTTFNAWRGNLEQLDDVCIIGVTI